MNIIRIVKSHSRLLAFWLEICKKKYSKYSKDPKENCKENICTAKISIIEIWDLDFKLKWQLHIEQEKQIFYNHKILKIWFFLFRCNPIMKS